MLLDGALHHLRKRAIGLDESLPIGGWLIWRRSKRAASKAPPMSRVTSLRSGDLV